jgi:hypothetical protein
MHGYVNMIRYERLLISNTKTTSSMSSFVERDRMKAGMWALFGSPWFIFGPLWVISVYISCGIKHIGKHGVLRCFSLLFTTCRLFFAQECEVN